MSGPLDNRPPTKPPKKTASQLIAEHAAAVMADWPAPDRDQAVRLCSQLRLAAHQDQAVAPAA